MDVLSNPGQSGQEQVGSNPPTQTPPPSDKPRWHMVGEDPGDIPSLTAVATATFSQNEDERKHNLQEEAKKCIDDPERMYLQYMRQSEEFRHNGLRVDGLNPPEELNAMMVLLHHSGRGREQEQNTSSVIGWAFRVLRKDEGFLNSVSWKGMDKPRLQNAAKETLGYVSEGLKNKSATMTQTDLDTCVTTALACGDSMNALNIIKLAYQVSPEGNEATKHAMSRLAGKNSIFDKAYLLYSQSAQERMDGILISLGEGNLKDFADIPQAQELKKQAEQRIRERLTEGRDQWYTAQKVADVDLRKAQLDRGHIESLIDQAVKNNKGWGEIEEDILAKASSLVDGEAANSIAAELMRRLHPELSLSEQIKQIKINDTNKPHYSTFNGYMDLGNGIYGSSSRDKELTPEEKKRKIDNVYSFKNDELLEDLFHPNKFDIKELVSFLKAPEQIDVIKTVVIPNYEAKLRPSISTSQLTEDLSKLEQNRQRLGEKLGAGIGYLKALAQNPETMRLIKQEFGFGDLIEPAQFQKAEEVLHKVFGNTNSNPEQIAEDMKVAEELAEFMKVEKTKTSDVKTEETKGVVKDMVGNVEKELISISSGRDQRNALVSQQQKLNADIPVLEEQINKLGQPKSAGFGFIRINRPPSDKDLKQKEEIETELKRKRDELADIQSQIANLGDVDESKIQSLTNRKNTLEKLAA